MSCQISQTALPVGVLWLMPSSGGISPLTCTIFDPSIFLRIALCKAGQPEGGGVYLYPVWDERSGASAGRNPPERDAGTAGQPFERTRGKCL